MPRGKHEEGDYYHIRLRDPDKLRNMKTTQHGLLKKVRGIDKKTGKWGDQNILIPKRNAEVQGLRLIIKTKKLKQEMQEDGILVSSIVRAKMRGRMDFKAKRKKHSPGKDRKAKK